MQVQCNVCGIRFETETAANNGQVYYEAHLIGIACTECQAKIWGNHVDTMP
jgi:hypothetical protein